MELAVFLRGELCAGGDGWLSLSLPVEVRESQAKGLVSFRVGGGGFEAVGGGATAGADGTGLLEGDSEDGDHGIEGRALVMLLKDSVLLAMSFSVGLVGSRYGQQAGTYAARYTRIPSVEGATSSSRFTLSRFEVLEMRLETDDEVRRVSDLASLFAESVSLPGTLGMSVSISSGGGGLDAETDLLVRERTEVASTASSKVSCSGV